MTDLVPRDSRIDGATLERVIQRAAELQAKDREFGEGLTESELMELGGDVGIPSVYLRQALLEERVGVARFPERGVLEWLTGPRRVAAERSIAGVAATLEAELRAWFLEGELLQVKRRFPDRTSWEPKEGAFASLKRSLGLGGRSYLLARGREVVSRVTQLDEQRCHVQLVADFGNTRNEYIGGAAFLGGAGGTVSAIAMVAGVIAPVALIPVAAAIPMAIFAARSRRQKIERVKVALEQVLDRLEHGEIRQRRLQAKSPQHPLGRIADEIRKSLDV